MAENNDIKAEGGQKSVWGLLKKVLKWVVIVAVIVIGLLAWAGNNLDVIDEKIQTWQAERYDRAMQKIADKKMAQYAADKDGGKTPEETLDLFISALKSGDIEKASKYYVLDKQEEELARLNKTLKQDSSLEKRIKNLEIIKNNSEKKCGINYDYGANVKGCTLTHSFIATEASTSTTVISGQIISFVTPKGAKDEMSFSVVENVYSGVWKIVY